MASYSFYVTEYGGKLAQGEFEAHTARAAAFIDYMLLGRTTGSKAEDMATCAVVDVFAASSDRLTAAGAIASENNDGYSVSYADVVAGDTPEAAVYRRAAAAARMYLRNSRRVEVIG